MADPPVPTEAPEDVIIAAATASVRTEGVNDGYIESTARDETFRAAVNSAFAAGVAAGRTRAAQDLLAYGVPDNEMPDGHGVLFPRELVAKIAAGLPEGQENT